MFRKLVLAGALVAARTSAPFATQATQALSDPADQGGVI